MRRGPGAGRGAWRRGPAIRGTERSMRVSHACALVLVTLLAACGGSTESTPTADTGLDALADLGLDAPSDASSDGTPDVAADVTPDASVDAAADGASDASCAACLSSGLAWKMDGGRVQSIDQMSIAPCRAYGRSRFAVSDLVHPTLTCSADLAHCAASADAAGTNTESGLMRPPIRATARRRATRPRGPDR